MGGGAGMTGRNGMSSHMTLHGKGVYVVTSDPIKVRVLCFVHASF